MIVTIDTGGTKTLIAAFADDGSIIDQIKFPTPKEPTAYTRLVRQTLLAHFGDTAVDAIVIAIPGIIKDGVAIWCNNLKWKNFNVAKAFEGALGEAPVFVDNDANLAGLGEVRALADIPELALYVTVSTGIGSGVITNGHIDPFLQYSEAGRSVVDFQGKAKEWETFASGKAIFKVYKQYARDIKSKRTWHQIADRISRGFLAIIPVLQPSVIIIGGSIGTYFDQYKKDLKAILKKHLPDHIPLPHIIQAHYPEQAVIYGCYYYALDRLTH